MPEWINVKDRLPDEGAICLMARPGGDPVIVACHRTGYSGGALWYSVPGSWNVAVTHWMPVPPAP